MNDGTWKVSRFIVTGLALYLVFLVSTIPAAWVGELLTRSTLGKARLLGSRGSLWNGSGTLVFSSTGGMALQNTLHWSINPLWLAAGKLRAELKSIGDMNLQATVTAGYRHLRLQNLNGEFAASHAQAIYPPAMLISPTGQIKMTGSDLALGKSGFDGELRLTWTAAGSKIGAAGELGDYLLVANGQNGAAALRVETLRGDVRIDARGLWQAGADGALTLDGTLDAGSRESTFGPMLSMMNARKEGNRHRIHFQGKFPTWYPGKPN